MSEKKELKTDQLEKVNGGEIVNGRSLEEIEEEASNIRALINMLQENQKNAKDIKEAMELMNQITEAMRKLQDLENEIEKNS